jgi:hypothetical protein
MKGRRTYSSRRFRVIGIVLLSLIPVTFQGCKGTIAYNPISEIVSGEEACPFPPPFEVAGSATYTVIWLDTAGKNHQSTVEYDGFEKSFVNQDNDGNTAHCHKIVSSHLKASAMQSSSSFHFRLPDSRLAVPAK